MNRGLYEQNDDLNLVNFCKKIHCFAKTKLGGQPVLDILKEVVWQRKRVEPLDSAAEIIFKLS